MTHIPAPLAFTLASALLGCITAQASIHCIWTKVSSNDQQHVSFLWGDPLGSGASLRLYHSAWSGRERTPLGCTWSDDAALIRSYLSLCQERTQEFSEHATKMFSLDYLLDADQCVSLGSPSFNKLLEQSGGRHVRSLGDQSGDERSEVRMHTRVKRSFIVPGTLWCGSGNTAPSYAELGVFSDTDSCCREHDQCKDFILSFHSDFGVFNRHIFTMSHCDCDNKFRRCLMEANDTIASAVGYTFFNLLKMPCFTFSHRLQCAERNWFGMCKKLEKALYADVQSPTLYESRESTAGCMPRSRSNASSSATAKVWEENTSHLDFLSTTASTFTVPASSATPSITAGTGLANTTDGEMKSATDSEAVTERRDDILPVKQHSFNQQYNNLTEEERSCIMYKELDECKNKILPRQRKYGLHNTEPATLYHCNCTARLFQTLAQQTQLDKLQALLLAHVAQSCFHPQNCTSGSNCTVVVVKAELPQLDARSVGDVEEQLHLLAVRRKVRRPEFMKAKRKDKAVRLYKLCLRMTRPRTAQKAKKHVQKAQQPDITTQVK